MGKAGETLRRFKVVLEWGEDGPGYVVRVPTFPCLVASHRVVPEEALARAREVSEGIWRLWRRLVNRSLGVGTRMQRCIRLVARLWPGAVAAALVSAILSGPAVAGPIPAGGALARSPEMLAVERLMAFGAVGGTRGDGQDLRLNGFLTRAELAKIIVVGAGVGRALVPPTGPVPADVVGHWSEPYVAAAESAGVLSGYPDGGFRPDAFATYGELVTALARAVGAPAVTGRPWPRDHLEGLEKAGGLPQGLPLAELLDAPAVRGPAFLLADYAFFNVRDSDGWSAYQRAHDAEPPGIEWRTTPPGLSGEAALRLEGRVVGGYRLWVQEQEVRVGPAGEFGIELALPRGVNRVRIAAEDLAGNRLEQELRVGRE